MHIVFGSLAHQASGCANQFFCEIDTHMSHVLIVASLSLRCSGGNACSCKQEGNIVPENCTSQEAVQAINQHFCGIRLSFRAARQRQGSSPPATCRCVVHCSCIQQHVGQQNVAQRLAADVHMPGDCFFALGGRGGQYTCFNVGRAEKGPRRL